MTIVCISCGKEFEVEPEDIPYIPLEGEMCNSCWADYDRYEAGREEQN